MFDDRTGVTDGIHHRCPVAIDYWPWLLMTGKRARQPSNDQSNDDRQIMAGCNIIDRDANWGVEVAIPIISENGSGLR